MHKGILNPVCPESVPAPGRWTESLPAGVCPGIRPAETKAQQPAPSKQGGGGVTGGAVQRATSQTRGPQDQNFCNKPEGRQRQVWLNSFDKAVHLRDVFKTFLEEKEKKCIDAKIHFTESIR